MHNSAALIPSIPWLNARRALLATLVIGSSIAGCVAMAQVVANLALGWRVTMLTLFGLTFSWIALAFWGAVCGFVICALRLDPLSLKRLTAERPTTSRLVSRTALVMPIYAEPPIPTIAGLEATCRSLLQQFTPQADDAAKVIRQHFEVFILSDTQDAAQAKEEAAHVAALQQRLAGQLAVHYRRRPNNHGRKAGNIADFCRRWGRRYDYMIVLDADSLMSGDTLLHMVHQMQRYPTVGLIQTVPIPVGQHTLFGRFTQLASALYSPMLAAGQSFWQGDAANYWGHNAIIRTRAFMAHAGLPTLSGKPPLGANCSAMILLKQRYSNAAAGRCFWILQRQQRFLVATHTPAPRATASRPCPATYSILPSATAVGCRVTCSTCDCSPVRVSTLSAACTSSLGRLPTYHRWYGWDYWYVPA
ncbi:glycosyltransferase [Halomonas sp. LY9]